jgi:hypothetical protein
MHYVLVAISYDVVIYPLWLPCLSFDSPSSGVVIGRLSDLLLDKNTCLPS